MEQALLKKVQFMSQDQYSSITTKSQENLYMVEFQPDLNVFPDYSKGVDISANTTYTVGSGVLANYSAGWFRIGLTGASWHGQSPQLTMTLNDQTFYISYFCAFTMVYLTSGNTFSCNSRTITSATFFPMKTV